MKKVHLILGLLCAIGLGFAIGYLTGFSKGSHNVTLGEFKVYQANLINGETREIPPPLREFIKARYYYLANQLPTDFLPIREQDYGEVKISGGTGLVIGKGPTTPQNEYKKYQAREAQQ